MEPYHLTGKEQAPPLIVLWIVPGRPGTDSPKAASARSPRAGAVSLAGASNRSTMGSPARWRLSGATPVQVR